jgi:hypothetical protein
VNGFEEFVDSGEWTRDGSSGRKRVVDKKKLRTTKTQEWALIDVSDEIKKAKTSDYSNTIFIKEEIRKARPAMAGKELGTYLRSSWVLDRKSNPYERIDGVALEKNEIEIARRVNTIIDWVRSNKNLMCIDASKFDSQPTQFENEEMIRWLYKCNGEGDWVAEQNARGYIRSTLTWLGKEIKMLNGMPSGVRETTACGVVWNTMMVGLAKGLAFKLWAGARRSLTLGKHWIRGDDEIGIDHSDEFSLGWLGVLLSLGYKVGKGKGTLMKEGEFLRARYTSKRTEKYGCRRLVSTLSKKPWNKSLEKFEYMEVVCHGFENIWQRDRENRDWWEQLTKSYCSRHGVSSELAFGPKNTGGFGCIHGKLNLNEYRYESVEEGSSLNVEVKPQVAKKFGLEAKNWLQSIFFEGRVEKKLVAISRNRSMKNSYNAALAASIINRQGYKPTFEEPKIYASKLNIPRAEGESWQKYLYRVDKGKYLIYIDLLKMFPIGIAIEMALDGSDWPKCPWPALGPVWDRYKNIMKMNHQPPSKMTLFEFNKYLLPSIEALRTKWINWVWEA